VRINSIAYLLRNIVSTVTDNLATWEVAIRRIKVQGQARQIVHKTHNPAKKEFSMVVLTCHPNCTRSANGITVQGWPSHKHEILSQKEPKHKGLEA
jgi:hypothetical protein